MKKSLILGFAALLAVVAFTGCKQDAEEKLPGTWSSAASLYTYTIDADNKRISGTGPEYVYTADYTMTADKYPSEQNTYNFTAWQMTKENYYTGFKGTASSTDPNTPYGFAFNINFSIVNQKTEWAYYAVFLEGNSFKLVHRPYQGKSVVLVDWTTDDVIKDNPANNKITVYTEENGSIIIKVNNKVLGTIRDPEFKSGCLGVLGCVTYESYHANIPVTSNYKFTDFQYYNPN